ncbi:LysR family transcriptional regulator [Enterococcus rivorum]|uniref:LysR family transcriptional regulator n=1 Tax=Enterococcus rivorum TaxID=762845 RepID=A0A1E5KYY3_9ENTE|nr:LysR family transcriptional regulator [Enterococcus rivorum]MBP2097561.1 DNA-binding transcriptional LysR family regulator [Enterococcus rivorum]OEH83013.1 LysR family transcriptional regulator [Enterococcus rivorum]
MFKLLRTFRVVYETKNFSKAANQLFISQPAVSSQIKQLEQELEVTLFIRSGRQDIQTTKQADILYIRLLNLSDDWSETLQALNKKERAQENCIIAASNTFAVHYLPELMKRAIQAFPTVSFSLEMGNSEEVLEKIEKHQAHFGFIEKPLISETVIRKEIMRDELVLAGDLSQELWLVREENSGVYHYTERFFLENNLNPEKLLIKNNEMIIKCLELGIGQSILSKKGLPKTLSFKQLGDEYWRPFYSVKRTHIKSRVLNEFGEFVHTYYEKGNSNEFD